MTAGVCAYCHAELNPADACAVVMEIYLDGVWVTRLVESVHTACVMQMQLKLACCVDGPMKEAPQWKP